MGVCLSAAACRTDLDCRQPDGFCSLPTTTLPKVAGVGAGVGGRRLAAAMAAVAPPTTAPAARRLLREREMVLVGAGNLDGTLAVLGGPVPAPASGKGAAKESGSTAALVAAAAEKPAAAASAAAAAPAAAATTTPAAEPALSAAAAASDPLAPGTCTPRRKADGAYCQADGECSSSWCGEARCSGGGTSCFGLCAPRPATLSAAAAAAAVAPAP
jgi:hypothetical protein